MFLLYHSHAANVKATSLINGFMTHSSVVNSDHHKVQYHFSNCDSCLSTSVAKTVKCKPYTFCTKLVQNNLECPILAIPNFLQSFCTKIVGKKFECSMFQSFWCKNTGRNSEWPKMDVPNFF